MTESLIEYLYFTRDLISMEALFGKIINIGGTEVVTN